MDKSKSKKPAIVRMFLENLKAIPRLLQKTKSEQAQKPESDSNYQTKEWEKKSKLLDRELQKKRKQRIKEQKREGSRKTKVRTHFSKAGVAVEHTILSRKMFNFAVAINLLLTGWMIYFYATREGYRLSTVLLTTVLIWFVLFFVILFILWLLFYLSLDVRIFKRKKSIEEVLPDFLELASANINAGMTIDKAMWYAVRPRFGVLSKEVEIVAKQTMSGMDLPEALQSFATKYDSQVLKRSINLLIEGINAGGEIGHLLHRIAINIKESQLLKKEMAASVTNYAIFITFAAVVAAPLLMALASQLLEVITKIIGSLDLPKTASIPIALSEVGIKAIDFKIFAYLNLGLTAFFSAVIVAIIKKGEVKEGVRFIPIFILVSFLIFFGLTKVFGLVLGSLI